MCDKKCTQCEHRGNYSMYCLTCNEEFSIWLDGRCYECKPNESFDRLARRYYLEDRNVHCTKGHRTADGILQCDECNTLSSFDPNNECKLIPVEAHCENSYDFTTGYCGTCLSTYYWDSLAGACKPCTNNCLSCSGPGQNECSSCKGGYFKDSVDYFTDGSCKLCNGGCEFCFNSDNFCYDTYCNTALGYVYSFDTFECVISHEHASRRCAYIEYDVCVGCKSYDAMYLGEGTLHCIDTFQNCAVHASRFGALPYCEVCQQGNYLTYKYILDTREGGQFYIKEDKYCEPCPSNCTKCASPTYCLHCDNPHTYYLDGLCIECSPECETCFGEGANKCLTCPGGAYALKGSCSSPEQPPNIIPVSTKFRFHTWILGFYTCLAIFSLLCRTSLRFSNYISDIRYKRRVQRKSTLWKAWKTKLAAVRNFNNLSNLRKLNSNSVTASTKINRIKSVRKKMKFMKI